MGKAERQGQLWGARAKDWVELQESQSAALFEAALRWTAVGSGTRLLDVGCGAGTLCSMAANLGADVSGFDASEALIAEARARQPGRDFRVGDMAALPYADGAFDVVTGINSFQFADDSVAAIVEARRVTRKGGRIAMAIWAEPEKCEVTPVLDALRGLMGQPASVAGGPPKKEVIRAMAEQAGLEPERIEEIECVWEYANLDTAIRAQLSSGLSAGIIEALGEDAVRKTLSAAIAPLAGSDGSIRFRNTFVCLVAQT